MPLTRKQRKELHGTDLLATVPVERRLKYVIDAATCAADEGFERTAESIRWLLAEYHSLQGSHDRCHVLATELLQVKRQLSMSHQSGIKLRAEILALEDSLVFLRAAVRAAQVA